MAKKRTEENLTFGLDAKVPVGRSPKGVWGGVKR